jgi:hypothetical protein
MWIKKEDRMGFVTISVILLLIGAFFLFAPKAKEVVYAPIEITGSQLSVVAPEKGKTLEGITVNAILKQPGFITVHRSIGGAPGEIVASTPLLQPGEYSAYEIPGVFTVEDDFIIMMFVDDGDGVYKARIDLPVMSNGVVLKAPFSAAVL